MCQTHSCFQTTYVVDKKRVNDGLDIEILLCNHYETSAGVCRCRCALRSVWLWRKPSSPRLRWVHRHFGGGTHFNMSSEDEKSLASKILGGVTPREAISILGLNHKAAWRTLEKWSRKSLYDYGVVLDLGWFTTEGETHFT